MSVKVQGLIWEYAPYRGNTLLAFLALGDWSDDEGRSWPNMKNLAKKSRQSLRNAHYAVELLCRDEFLAADLKQGKGQRNAFQINMQKLHVLAGYNMQSATPKHATSDAITCKTRHRNKEEPSGTVIEPSVEPKSKSPLPPFFQKGGDELFELANRDRRRIAKYLKDLLEPGPDGLAREDTRNLTYTAALQLACADLLLPFEAVKKVLAVDEAWQSRLELPKPPQRVATA